MENGSASAWTSGWMRMSARPCLHSVSRVHEGLRHSNIARAARHHAATTCAPPHPLPRHLRLLGDAPQQAAIIGESLAATLDLLLKHPDETFATCN
jgi:alpha-beta hydrolase superfamily lysophospholipase